MAGSRSSSSLTFCRLTGAVLEPSLLEVALARGLDAFDFELPFDLEVDLDLAPPVDLLLGLGVVFSNRSALSPSL